MEFSKSLILLPVLIFFIAIHADGFGTMGPISASFGQNGFFCAIDASGKQDVICWGKNTSSAATPLTFSSDLPPMAALAGGDGFMCGILSNTSQAYCWDPTSSARDLVPSIYQTTAYSHISAGTNHVCAIRGPYYSDYESGTVDCWEIVKTTNKSLTSVRSNLFYDQSVSNLVFKRVVSGDGFSCGGITEGGLVCWGPKSASFNMSNLSEDFVTLASGKSSVCGVLGFSKEAVCWGDSSDSSITPPVSTKFVSLAAGTHHFCGIKEDDHGVECWGNFNSSSIPKGSGFMAIASSDSTTCGIREDDLILDCWSVNSNSSPDYDPPLQLCSPGLCSFLSCKEGEFTFNASSLNEPDLTNLCVRKDLKICSPCGFNCSDGYFPSSPCIGNADRVCTACSLCQNSSCWDFCGVHLQSTQINHKQHHHQWKKLLLIIGCSVLGFLLTFLFVLVLILSLRSCLIAAKKEDKTEFETDANGDSHSHPPLSTAPSLGMAQLFRLTELKDATNGFKEFNELGRGSYGFVYKAILQDGRQVAVKRANAATIIHTNSRDFEFELETLCKIRHPNIVNLLGYCSEMGERLLVYEFMPHGTLHDHLHGGSSPLNWNLRLKIAMQAAKGLEYLHKEADPPIIHRDVKSSNILLDSDWVARIADFGLITSPCEKEFSNGDMSSDVYNFGIVLLEIFSGRKAYDKDCMPPSIVEWAVPLIRKGKAAAIIDRYVTLPRNFEPLLKLADIAELALKENSSQRPGMSDIAAWLDQIVKDGFVS